VIRGRHEAATLRRLAHPRKPRAHLVRARFAASYSRIRNRCRLESRPHADARALVRALAAIERAAEEARELGLDLFDRKRIAHARRRLGRRL
jgi:hypothetical protein